SRTGLSSGFAPLGPLKLAIAVTPRLTAGATRLSSASRRSFTFRGFFRPARLDLPVEEWSARNLRSRSQDRTFMELPLQSRGNTIRLAEARSDGANANLRARTKAYPLSLNSPR